MKKLTKIISLVLVLAVGVVACVSCSGKQTKKEPSSVPLVKPATTKEYTASTEEDFVKALENFANPNGNKFDALAVLGDFDSDESHEDLLKRYEEASKKWHDTVVKTLADDYAVTMLIKSKTKTDKNDAKVTEWEEYNNLKCQDFANIKCTISTNYAKDDVTISYNIVKLDGRWHFATSDSMDSVLRAMLVDIYK